MPISYGLNIYLETQSNETSFFCINEQTTGPFTWDAHETLTAIEVTTIEVEFHVDYGSYSSTLDVYDCEGGIAFSVQITGVGE